MLPRIHLKDKQLGDVQDWWEKTQLFSQKDALTIVGNTPALKLQLVLVVKQSPSNWISKSKLSSPLEPALRSLSRSCGGNPVDNQNAMLISSSDSVWRTPSANFSPSIALRNLKASLLSEMDHAGIAAINDRSKLYWTMIAKETTMGTKFYMLNDPWHPNWLHKMNPQAPWKQIAPVFFAPSQPYSWHWSLVQDLTLWCWHGFFIKGLMCEKDGFGYGQVGTLDFLPLLWTPNLVWPSHLLHLKTQMTFLPAMTGMGMVKTYPTIFYEKEGTHLKPRYSRWQALHILDDRHFPHQVLPLHAPPGLSSSSSYSCPCPSS